MNYSIFDFLSLLGAVCLFLYGMKVMSEGLQKVAGDRLRNILGIMTKNRVTGVITGILITALIQSSSASTVMVVSFVNAGLMSLGQAMAVIFGANVGTTVTTWIISAFSFEVSISDYSVLLLAVGVPMLFMKKSFYKSLGEFLIGFCFLFMGLDLISHYVPNLQENPSMLEFLTKYTSMGYGSVLIFFFIGIIVTMVAQSSAATFAITLIMCSQGWITYELGCAIILGGNIGTTITPVLASLSGNLAAKRTAMGHVLFNVLGSIIVLIIFVPFVTLVADITQWLEGTNPMTITAAEESAMADSTLLTPAGGLTAKAQASMAFALAMFPTVFNACNLLIMIWFTNLYVKIVCWIMPARHKETDEDFSLKFIGRGMLGTSELNITQAQKEILVYAERVERMLGMSRELIHLKEKNENYTNLYSRIEKYEEISDRMEIEIANFLNRVAEGRLSPEGKMRVAGMLRIISEIESIADSCFNIAKTLNRKNQVHVEFEEPVMVEIDKMYDMVQSAMKNMLEILRQMESPEDANIITAYNKEREINNFRDRLRDDNIFNINNKVYDYQEGIFFMDLIGEAEKLGDFMLNVVEGVKHQFKTQAEA
ncbi:Na/Pi cotransporter family protein [bacterium]|nr:Na/Pi cotransporter family protein [Bacteroides sp.]MBD5338572.1 Na/Pi cotransporter family protein [Bacteroides sp.]MBD5385754.1 Na/Pi cotransporter family protein [bacterium]MDE6806279.1 Na/Pi cotransporter family protein [Muribaculaceae bacterium]MDE7510503.1 Na/Pi cotransporter family protein [Muribaculaceae bacterium]